MNSVLRPGASIASTVLTMMFCEQRRGKQAQQIQSLQAMHRVRVRVLE